jgi:hypothetical protein
MMAFAKPGYVVSVVDSSNKPIREFMENGVRVARIPFSSEYKVRLKNTTNKRCYAEVEIDGMKIDAEARRLVFGADQEIDLERFVDSMKTGQRFKFVSSGDSQVQDPTSKENGKIKVTFYPEKIYPYATSWTTTVSSPQPWWGGHSGILRSYTNSSAGNGGMGTVCSTNAFHMRGAVEGNAANVQLDSCMVTKDAGATVGGSTSSQEFKLSNESFFTETPVVIEIQLRGPSREPVYKVLKDGKEIACELSPDGLWLKVG